MPRTPATFPNPLTANRDNKADNEAANDPTPKLSPSGGLSGKSSGRPSGSTSAGGGISVGPSGGGGGGGGGLTRKQREIRDREQRILWAGRQILLARGYTGLTMDRVAAAIEYSKGTVYQHFKSKEDLIAAIAAQTHAKRAAFFTRAAHWRARSRERVMALGVADQILTTIDNEHAAIERVIDIDSLTDKVDLTRRKTIDQAKQGIRTAFEHIIQDAVAEGDLVLTDEHHAERIHYGLATMAIGHATASGGCLADHALDPEGLQSQRDHHTRLLWRNYHTWLDAHDWKPLFADHDYDAVTQRVHQEVFPTEAPAPGPPGRPPLAPRKAPIGPPGRPPEGPENLQRTTF